MIEIFEGRIGGGKTYSAVERIVSYVGNGGLVYTNVELLWDGLFATCEDRFQVQILQDQIRYFSENDIYKFFEMVPPGTKEHPVLIVIDEAHLWFNSRDWNKAPRATMGYLSQSRKLGHDLIFITQKAENMDSQIRRLAQFTFRFRDMDKFPLLGLPLWKGKIRWMQVDYDGKTILKSGFKKKQEYVFKSYNTNALLRDVTTGEEAPTHFDLKKKEEKKMANPFVLLTLILGGLIGGGFLVWKVAFNDDPIIPHSSVVASAPGVSRSAPVPAPAPRSPRYPEPVILASVHTRNGTGVYVEGVPDVLFNGDGLAGGQIVAIGNDRLFLEWGPELLEIPFIPASRVQLRSESRPSPAKQEGDAISLVESLSQQGLNIIGQ